MMSIPISQFHQVQDDFQILSAPKKLLSWEFQFEKFKKAVTGSTASRTGSLKFDIVATISGGYTMFEIKPKNDLNMYMK